MTQRAVQAARRAQALQEEDAALRALLRKRAGPRAPSHPCRKVTTPPPMEGLFRQALLVLPRLLPILFMVPVFSGRVVTGAVRSGLIAILAVFVAPAMEGTALGAGRAGAMDQRWR